MFNQSDCPNHPLAYSIKEASAVSGLSRTTLYELRKSGLLSMVKVGNRTLIRHDALDAILGGEATSSAG